MRGGKGRGVEVIGERRGEQGTGGTGSGVKWRGGGKKIDQIESAESQSLRGEQEGWAGDGAPRSRLLLSTPRARL